MILTLKGKKIVWGRSRVCENVIYTGKRKIIVLYIFRALFIKIYKKPFMLSIYLGN